MAMNVKPVPTLDDEVNEIRLATAEIVNKDILPAEAKLWGWMSDSANAPNEAAAEARSRLSVTLRVCISRAPIRSSGENATSATFSMLSFSGPYIMNSACVSRIE